MNFNDSQVEHMLVIKLGVMKSVPTENDRESFEKFEKSKRAARDEKRFSNLINE